VITRFVPVGCPFLPLPPVACWWARTTVESTETRRSGTSRQDEPVWPLYLSANFFGAPPRYVHWRFEQMRWQAGLDPVTGKPAPGRNSF